MDFGRIHNFEQVDFTLPPDHSSISKVLGGVKHPCPQAYVGGVRWVSDSFAGTIYPAKTKPRDFMKEYVHQFNTIELNSTHYGLPSKETLRRWKEAAPAGFRFCPKINQAISHAPDLAAMTDLHQEHCNTLYVLEDKLGTAFLQLPPFFSTGRASELRAFLDKNTLPGMAIELRHESWFSQDTQLNDLCNYLYKKQLGLVLTDTPGRRDALHMRLTNKQVFVRFNAHSNYEGDKARIDSWMERAKNWFDQGLEQFCFFVHTPQQLFMPQLVIYTIQQLEKTGGISLKPPVLYNTPK